MWRTLAVGVLSFRDRHGSAKVRTGGAGGACRGSRLESRSWTCSISTSTGVAIVGPIQSGLPSIGFPNGLTLSDYFVTWASAFGVMLVAFAEGLRPRQDHATMTTTRSMRP